MGAQNFKDFDEANGSSRAVEDDAKSKYMYNDEVLQIDDEDSESDCDVDVEGTCDMHIMFPLD
jgi:hypothetical protein